MDSKERENEHGGHKKNPKNIQNDIVFPSDLCGDMCDQFNEIDDISVSSNGPLSDLNFGSNGSCYSSPLSSEMESTETESEDEVSLAELTRRMAEFTFQDDDDEESDGLSHKNPTNLPSDNSEATGESSKLSQYNTSSYGYDYHKKGFMRTPENPAAESVIHSLQVYQLRNQTEMEKKGRKVKGVEQKEQQSKGKALKSYGHGKKGNLAHVLSAQGGGSGMRAVFLGGSNGRSGSGGTGVFLPSAVYSQEEPRRKRGCSTVLIPARVLQTLQQHFKNVQSQSHNTSGYVSNQPWQNDVLTRINGLLSQQQELAEFQTNVSATKSDPEELRLPQEWTY